MTPTGPTKNWISVASRLRTTAPILVLIGLVALIGMLKPGFLTLDTLVVVMADTATLFIIAAGVTFVIMLGGIDLSIQSVASLSSVIVAVLLPAAGYWAFPAALLAGLFTGTFSGIG